MRPCLRAAVAACFAVALAAGCGRSHQPTTPVGPEIRADATLGDPWSIVPGSSNRISGRVPLEVGDTWHYQVRLTLTLLDSVTLAPVATVEYRSSYENRITGFEEINGIRYAAVAQTGPMLTPSVFWWRQDRDGLYEYEGPTILLNDARAGTAPSWEAMAVAVPAIAHSATWRRAWESMRARSVALALGRPGPAGPAAVGPGEIQRLAYPLVRGQRWVVRQDPYYESVIEGSDLLRTPAGTFACWRVRLDASYFGPRDRAVAYWGKDGYIGLRAHARGVMTDNEGNVTGIVNLEQEELLDSLSLVRR